MINPRLKTCKACGEKFAPASPMQAICRSVECIVTHANNLKAKRERREKREAKAKLKTRRDWLREAQFVFNKWIRLRDKGKACISCGRNHTGQLHAGHYLSIGACPELRFNEDNVHLQCQPCNTHLSGNIIRYREGLIEKIGLERVEWLEGHHEPKKYTVEDLKAIKAKYAALAKELS